MFHLHKMRIHIPQCTVFSSILYFLFVSETQETPESAPEPPKKSSDKDEEEKVIWTRPAILMLLRLWQQHQGEFASPKTKKKAIWLKIAAGLCEAGFHITFSQAESKWKNLTRKYRDVVDNNNTSGRERKVCAYYEELSEIYGYKPNVNPTAVQSSLPLPSQAGCSTPTPSRKRKDLFSDEEKDESDGSEAQVASPRPSSTPTSRKYAKKPKSNSQEVIDAMKAIHEEQKQAEQNRLKLAKDMHDEKMDMFSKFLDILKGNSK